MFARTLGPALITLFLLASGASADPPDEVRAEPLVDINTASAEELEKLPGIGPTKARAIVEYRTRRRFPSPASIQRVKGIGRATYLRIRHRITVGNR